MSDTAEKLTNWLRWLIADESIFQPSGLSSPVDTVVLTKDRAIRMLDGQEFTIHVLHAGELERLRAAAPCCPRWPHESDVLCGTGWLRGGISPHDMVLKWKADSEQVARLEAERAEIAALLAALNAPSHLSSMTQRFRATYDDIHVILARKG